MIGPRRERCALFLFVDRTIVDTGDSSLVAADMVQHRFDDMRRDAKLGHAGRDAAAQIMLRPVIEPAAARRASSSRLPRDQDAKALAPQKTKLPPFGCWAARTACAGVDSGTTCVLLFFVLMADNSISPEARDSFFSDSRKGAV